MRTLAPLALLYTAAKGLHRRVGLRSGLKNPDSLLPLIVIGGMRAGGSGKTSVTLELARRLSSQGSRVGILAYWIQKSRKRQCDGLRPISGDLAEVLPESDWRCCSDEAVLLARASGARVFVARNREKAWDHLSRLGEFDLLLSDDGLMDPRLRKSFRIVLRRPGEFPGLFDLLPAGPYRMTADILDAADCVVEGPLSGAEPGGFWFRRKLLFPEGFNRHQGHWILSGLGNPEAFHQDLSSAGVSIRGISRGPNHGLPNLRRSRAQAAKELATAFICTSKDWVKLANRTAELGAEFRAVVTVGEQIELGPSLVSAVEKYLKSCASS